MNLFSWLCQVAIYKIWKVDIQSIVGKAHLYGIRAKAYIWDVVQYLGKTHDIGKVMFAVSCVDKRSANKCQIRPNHICRITRITSPRCDNYQRSSELSQRDLTVVAVLTLNQITRPVVQAYRPALCDAVSGLNKYNTACHGRRPL